MATRTGGVPDLVDDGVTGLLVPPRRPELLADAIVRMMTETGLRESCAGNALTKSSTYDYSDMVDGTVDVYRGMVERRVGVAR